MTKTINNTLFNQEHKEAFIIDNYVAGAANVRSTLELCYPMEKALNKDLSLFNRTESDNLVKSLNRGTYSSVSTVLSILRSYTHYSIQKGINKTGINYYKLITGRKRIEKFINPMSDKMVGAKDSDRLGRYITRGVLHNIMDFCVNHQDAALFGMLFEGASGIQHEEIINLKKSDCDFETGKVTLTRTEVINKITGETRELYRSITIEDEIILFRLKKASEQMVYETNNGDNLNSKNPSLELYDSEYVFRPSTISNINKMTRPNINRRMRAILKAYRNEFINAQSLLWSGVIDKAQKMRCGLGVEELEKEHYQLLVKKFNLSNNNSYWYSLKSKIGKYI